jgi:hypothetical protein
MARRRTFSAALRWSRGLFVKRLGDEILQAERCGSVREHNMNIYQSVLSGSFPVFEVLTQKLSGNRSNVTALLKLYYPLIFRSFLVSGGIRAEESCAGRFQPPFVIMRGF